VEEIFVSHTHALLVSGLSKLDDTWQHCPNDQTICCLILFCYVFVFTMSVSIALKSLSA
jgi:hypothetical protein